MQPVKPGNKFSDFGVHELYGIGGFPAVWAMLVACAVHLRHVQSDEMRPLLRRQTEPGQHLLDPLIVWN